MKKLTLAFLISAFLGSFSQAIAQQHTVFIADTWSYRLFTIDEPCIDKSRRKLTFRAEFRDPVLARDPEIVARAAIVGASSLLRWPNRYTCIDHGNFVGEVTSYYSGDLMFRARTHLTDRLHTMTPQSAERFGGLKRGTAFSKIIRAYVAGEYRADQHTPPDIQKFVADLDNAEITEGEKPDLAFVIASALDRENQPFLPNRKPASQDIMDRLNFASENGVQGATLHLLLRAGIRDTIYEIRGRATKGDASVTPAEREILTQNLDLINRALEQKIGLMLLLKSEMDRFGLSIDPSVVSTNTNAVPVAFNIERALNRMLRVQLTGADKILQAASALPPGAAYACDEDWCYAANGILQLRFLSRSDPQCLETAPGRAKCDFKYSLVVRGGDFLQLEGDVRTKLMNAMTNVAAAQEIHATASFQKSGGEWRVLLPIRPKE